MFEGQIYCLSELYLPIYTLLPGLRVKLPNNNSKQRAMLPIITIQLHQLMEFQSENYVHGEVKSDINK